MTPVAAMKQVSFATPNASPMALSVASFFRTPFGPVKALELPEFTRIAAPSPPSPASLPLDVMDTPSKVADASVLFKFWVGGMLNLGFPLVPKSFGSGTATFGAKGSGSPTDRQHPFPKQETEREKWEREEMQLLQDFFMREQRKDKKLLAIWHCQYKQMVFPFTAEGAAANPTVLVERYQDWEHAKWTLKSSMVNHMFDFVHLIEIHWTVAGSMAQSRREHLPQEHPLRQFLRPFSYNTIMINWAATTTLVTDGGAFHRFAAWTPKETAAPRGVKR